MLIFEKNGKIYFVNFLYEYYYVINIGYKIKLTTHGELFVQNCYISCGQGKGEVSGLLGPVLNSDNGLGVLDTDNKQRVTFQQELFHVLRVVVER